MRKETTWYVQGWHKPTAERDGFWGGWLVSAENMDTAIRMISDRCDEIGNPVPDSWEARVAVNAYGQIERVA